MDEDYMKKLALVVEGFEDLFGDSSIGVLVQMPEKEFKDKQSSFRDIDKTNDKFSIRISNVDFVFISIPDA